MEIFQNVSDDDMKVSETMTYIRGKVGIGTTSPSGPAAGLHVKVGASGATVYGGYDDLIVEL